MLILILLVQHQSSLNALYEYQILVSETIPGIQAEYNLLADMMAQSKQFSDAKRLLLKIKSLLQDGCMRSLLNLTDVNSISTDDLDDFLADLETFNIYLKAQLNGNPELGVAACKQC